MKALIAMTLCCLSLYACGGGRTDTKASKRDATEVDASVGARTSKDEIEQGAVRSRDAAPPPPVGNLIDLLPVAAGGHMSAPRPDGEWRHTYPDGSVWEEGTYEDGQMVGTFTRYYRDGQRSLEAAYVAGQKHGNYTSWYANGQIFEQGRYIAGERDGTWTSFYENGQALEEAEWNRGRQVSVTTHLADGKTVTKPITGSPFSVRDED